MNTLQNYLLNASLVKTTRLPIIWMSMVLYTERSETDLISLAILVPSTMQPYILYECHSALELNGSTRLYHFIARNYFWEKLHEHCK